MVSRRRRWRRGEEERCEVLVGKVEGKLWLGRPRSKWDGNIKNES